jgi:hypothetical protein
MCEPLFDSTLLGKIQNYCLFIFEKKFSGSSRNKPTAVKNVREWIVSPNRAVVSSQVKRSRKKRDTSGKLDIHINMRPTERRESEKKDFFH